MGASYPDAGFPLLSKGSCLDANALHVLADSTGEQLCFLESTPWLFSASVVVLETATRRVRRLGRVAQMWGYMPMKGPMSVKRKPKIQLCHCLPGSAKGWSDDR